MDADSLDAITKEESNGDDDAPDTTPSRTGRGGPRPGGGRPKGAKDTQPRLSRANKRTFRERYETAVEKNARQLIDAAIKAGTRGDSRMLLDMVTRFVGPARTSLEISGPNGAPLQLQAMTAAALVSLTDAQLDALAAFHAQLQPAPSGDSALSPLLLPPGQTLPPARAGSPTLADDHDTPGHTPDVLTPQTQPDSPDTHDTERAEGENGGSPASPSTPSHRQAGSAQHDLEGGESA